MQLAADTSLTFWCDSCCGYAALEVVKRILGVHSFFLIFGSSWLIFFTGTVLELLGLWFYHVGKVAKCVHWKYRNNTVCIMRSCPFSMMSSSFVYMCGLKLLGTVADFIRA